MDWRASIIPRIGRFHGIYKSTFEEVVFNPDIKNSLVVQMIPSKLIDARLIWFSLLYNFCFLLFF